MILLIDIFVNMLFATIIALKMNFWWALFYMMNYIGLTAYINYKHTLNGVKGYLRGIIKDIISLLAFLFISTFIEKIVSSLTELLNTNADIHLDNATQLKSVEGVDGLEVLVIEGNKALSVGNNFANKSNELHTYNNIFGLSAAELVLITYVIVRLFWLITVLHKTKS